MIETAYEKAYGKLCGVHPDERCWHFQWLAVRRLHADLERVLSDVRGKVLDVGCGSKPYARYLKHVGKGDHLGIDVVPAPAVDVTVVDGESWPFEEASFDAAICTQVLEHVPDFGKTVSEIHRVLAPGGILVVTAPFIYGEHGAPRDFRRFSLHGARHAVADRFEVVESGPQGGIGSTLGTLLLCWLDTAFHRNPVTRRLRFVLLPAWVLFCMVVNGLGVLFDALDRTGAFYGNVLLVARKPAREGFPPVDGDRAS